MSGNIRLSPDRLERRFGAEKTPQFSDEAVLARADLARFIADEKIQCDFQPISRVIGLTGQFSVDRIKRYSAAFKARYDIEPVFIEKRDMAEYTSSPIYSGSTLRPDIGGIHPAKLLHEMKRLILEASVELFSFSQQFKSSTFLTLSKRNLAQAVHHLCRWFHR